MPFDNFDDYHKFMKIRASSVVVAFLVLLLFSSSSDVEAIENGKTALGAPVVAISFGSSSQAHCSGALIDSRIVITANHCFPTAGSDVNYLVKNKLTVWRPGVVLNPQNRDVANVVKVVAKSEEWKIGECEKGYCDDLNDLMFLIIDQSFPVPSNLILASKDDIARFRSSQVTAITYGYGRNRFTSDPLITPRKMEGRFEMPNLGGYGELAFNLEIFGNQNVCSGDSGGPSYVIENDSLYYVGPTSGSRRPSCIEVSEKSSGFYGGTPLAFKNDLLVEAKRSLLEIKELEELKATQEAAAKAAANKKITITCVKGKLSKKVTAVKPVCPKGYVKK